MKYKATHVQFEIKYQQEGTAEKAPVRDGVQILLEAFPGKSDGAEMIRIQIITTTTVGMNFLKFAANSYYKVEGYVFPDKIESSDMVSITKLAKTAKDALKHHSKTYDNMQKAPYFDGYVIPFRSENDIKEELIELIKMREVPPEQRA